MIELFKKNLFINSLLLLPYALVLRLKCFISPRPSHDFAENGIQELIIGSISSPLAQNILATLLVFLQAVFLNRLVIKHRLANEITLWPGVAYILLCSFFPAYSYLSLPLVANTFILLMLAAAFQTYNKTQAAGLVFNVGFFCGLASLVYAPTIWYIIVGYVSLMVFKSVRWNDRVQLISGILVPYYLWAIWKYVRYDDAQGVGTYVRSMFNISKEWSMSAYSSIALALLVVMGISFVIKYSSYLSKKTIQVQKRIDVLFWALLFAALTLVFAGPYAAHALLMFIPAAFFVSQHWLRVKSAMTLELIHLGMVVFLFLLHFDVLPISL